MMPLFLAPTPAPLSSLFLTLTSTPALPVVKYFSTDLRYGMSNNNEVRRVQAFLKERGYYVGAINGYYNSATQLGVIKFQVANRISPATGFWRSQTRRVANGLLTQTGIGAKVGGTRSIATKPLSPSLTPVSVSRTEPRLPSVPTAPTPLSLPGTLLSLPGLGGLLDRPSPSTPVSVSRTKPSLPSAPTAPTPTPVSLFLPGLDELFGPSLVEFTLLPGLDALSGQMSVEPAVIPDGGAVVLETNTSIVPAPQGSQTTQTSLPPPETTLPTAPAADTIVSVDVPTFSITSISANTRVGESVQFDGVYDPDGPAGPKSPLPKSESPSINWGSSNTEIAEIGASGLVAGVKRGTVTITGLIRDSSGKDFAASATLVVQASLSPVVFPVSGSRLETGKPYTLKWDSATLRYDSAESPVISLRLVDAGSIYRLTIAQDIPNTGRYEWTIPVSVPSGSKYFLRIWNKPFSQHVDSGGFAVVSPATGSLEYSPTASFRAVVNDFFRKLGVWFKRIGR